MSDFRLLKMQVQRQLKRDLDKANTYFNTIFTPPTVSYAVRGVKAGVAYLHKNEIRFNPILLTENGQDFIQQVVPHELAHLLVYQQFGRVKPHGKEWQMMMETVLGIPAETYHCFDTSSVQGQRFEYQCQCQTHWLSIRRHQAILREKRQYICRQCKTTLQFVGNSTL
ncbi:SprT family zinc-dependent metalloprotease [Otariodibacter oris]|uniref:Protein SprT n=1 Tax=Otariodibacter oris TaxID=1032623 RepID=A0A420XEE3_9PAST|nr:SprT family zinc-dependent metalloprotease [Otariodibacter oris]QGM80209.1 SprT family protein [Otariodibacter oris]RKR70601.1 SprT protein [Otariodibacter oris]